MDVYFAKLHERGAYQPPIYEVVVRPEANTPMLNTHTIPPSHGSTKDAASQSRNQPLAGREESFDMGRQRGCTMYQRDVVVEHIWRPMEH